MKHAARLAVSIASLYALMYAVASHATDVATKPLKADVLVKPNVIFGMDDSGSMDSEVMLNNNDGAFWWDFNAGTGWNGSGRTHYNDAGAASSQWRKMVYLFPNGTGTGNRVYADADFSHFAILPTAPFAFLRSSAYNPIYYDPAVTYRPWAPAYFNGSLSTPPIASSSAVKSHPAYGTSTMNVSATISLNRTANFVFTALPGMRIPAGADKIVCNSLNASCGSWTAVTADEDATSNRVTHVAMAYFPATYFVRMNPSAVDTSVRDCTVDGVDCITAPDGGKLKRYEIKSTTTFPQVDSLGRARTYAEELQNFANWFQYYRKRKLMLAAAMGRVMETLHGMRLGVVAFNSHSNATMYDADAASAASNARRVAGIFYEANGSGGTPTRQTLKYIGEQYRRTDTTGSVYNMVQYACQRNNAFIVTDGFANASTVTLPAYDSGTSSTTWGSGAPYETIHPNGTLADLALRYYTNNPRPTLAQGVVGATANDSNTNLHMNTYALTMGARGTIFVGDDTPVPTTAGAWPNPNLDRNPTSVDDLWHATINGRGKMYLSTTPEETAVRVQNGLNHMVDQVGAQSSVSVSSVNLAQGDHQAYLGMYNPAGWSGDVTANAINTTTGAISDTDTWSAAAQLLSRNLATSPRIIATHNGSTAVAFRSTSTGIADLVNPSDVYGSDAEVIDYLRGDRSDEGIQFRRRTSLMGAVINARPVVSGPDNVVYAASSEGMLHAFDTATGNELWAYVPYSVLGEIGQTTSRSWTFETMLDGSPTLATVGSRKILVGGRGAGGSGFYALDVTAPRSVTSETGLASNVLWEFPGTSSAYPMGLSVGKPVVASTRTRGDVVLLTQGYNGISGGTAVTDGRSRVYMLNALTGAVIHTFVVNGGGTDPGLAQLSSLPESDGKTIYAYGGDERGNLWRFDLENLSAMRMAQLTDSGGSIQPITAAPQVVRYRDMRIVMVGTGRLLGSFDLTNPLAGRQTIYAIKDTNTELTTPRTTLTPRTLSNEDGFGERDLSGAAFNWSSDRGWYFDLPAGQQANTDPVAAYGMLVLTTNQATMSNCSASSYLYLVDVLSGMNVTTGWNFEAGTSGTSYAARRISNLRNASGISVQRGDTGNLIGSCMLSNAETCRTGLPNMFAVQPRKNSWRQIHRE